MADDFITAKKELRRYFPKPFYNLRDGQGLAILLDAYGDQLERLFDDGQSARAQYLLATAFGDFLEVHGKNRDVFRPRGFNMTDNVYRQLIEIITNSPKNIEDIFERIIFLFFGPNSLSHFQGAGERLADIYSIRKNEMVLEIRASALIIASSRNLIGTAYLHPDRQGFTGTSGSFSTNLAVAASAGDTQIEITSTVDVPLKGVIRFPSDSEIKVFDRVGTTIFFKSGLANSFSNGTTLVGGINPSDFPSGYTYDREIRSSLVGLHSQGSTDLTIFFEPERFPLEGTVYIGSPAASNFEAKGYTRIGGDFTLKGGLNFTHVSGENVILPNMPRKIKTVLDQTITAGQSFSELTVINGADFPLDRAALIINRSFGNVEIVPFTSRKIADNQKLIIDPNYTFQFNHSSGERINLMARQTAPTIDGLNFQFFLNDTDALREQFFNIIRRLKVQGVKIVFIVK